MIGMNNSGHVPPLRELDVEAMGLALGPICDVQHRPGMKTHRHLALPERPDSEEGSTTHSCPTCGDVHLPPSGPEVAG